MFVVHLSLHDVMQNSTVLHMCPSHFHNVIPIPIPFLLVAQKLFPLPWNSHLNPMEFSWNPIFIEILIPMHTSTPGRPLLSLSLSSVIWYWRKNCDGNGTSWKRFWSVVHNTRCLLSARSRHE